MTLPYQYIKTDHIMVAEFTAPGPSASPEASVSQQAQVDSTAGDHISQQLPERKKPPKAKKEKAPKPPKGPTPPKTKREPAAKNAPEDPDSMFKVGFLAEVYQERPTNSKGIQKVRTRCMSSFSLSET